MTLLIHDPPLNSHVTPEDHLQLKIIGSGGVRKEKRREGGQGEQRKKREDDGREGGSKEKNKGKTMSWRTPAHAGKSVQGVGGYGDEGVEERDKAKMEVRKRSGSG